MSSPLVVHSVPTARPSAVGNQGLAWVGGGGWGRRTQCGRPDTSGGCPARPQWARHAIGRGRGPDHSIGARSVAPRLWTAPLTPPGLGMHRPRAGAGRFTRPWFAGTQRGTCKPHAQPITTTTGGGVFAPGCPQRPDGAAVGCGQPGACLGGWWWLGAAHPVWTAGHLWGVSCPPTMGTPRDRARTRARPQHRGAISRAPAMDGPAHTTWAGHTPAPARGRTLRGRG